MPKKPINQDVQKVAELAMAKSLKDAKAQAEALLPPIIENLFKIFIWGDNPEWRTEIKERLNILAETKVDLKNRNRLTKFEYFNSMADFTSEREGHFTVSRYIINVFHDMNLLIPNNLNEKVIGEKVVKTIDDLLFHLSSNNKGARLNSLQVDQIIDRELIGWNSPCKL